MTRRSRPLREIDRRVEDLEGPGGDTPLEIIIRDFIHRDGEDVLEAATYIEQQPDGSWTTEREEFELEREFAEGEP